MDSSLSFEWNRPIIFDRNLVTKLESIAQKFQTVLLRELLNDAKLNPADYPNFGSLEVAYGTTPQSISYDTFSKAKDIEPFSWSVEYADGTEIKNITVEQLLNLPNVGATSIKNVTLSVGRFSTLLKVRCWNIPFVAGTKVDINSSFDHAQRFREDVQILLKSVTEPWWPVRNKWVIWTVIFAPAVVGIISDLIDVFQGKPSGYANAPWGIIFVVLVLGVPAALMATRIWDWIFPMVDFQFGGGIQRAAVRKNVRRATLGVPIMGVLIPYLVNRL